MLQGSFDSLLDAAAAGDFHADDGNAFNVICQQDLGQFAAVIFIIQLWAADECDVVFDEFAVEVTVSKGCTVSGNEKSAVLQISCVGIDQFDLDRPLLQLAGLGHLCWCRMGRLQLLCLRSWAAYSFLTGFVS